MPSDYQPIDLDELIATLEETNAGWEAGETSMTVLSPEEQLRRYGLLVTPRDLAMIEAEELNQPILEEEDLRLGDEEAAEPPPASFDLRNTNGKNYGTPVRNQGDCNSCVAFGVVATLEHVARYTRKKTDLNLRLSEADLFFCLGKKKCTEGWNEADALNAIAKSGIAYEKCYPYTPITQKCKVNADCKKNNQAKIKTWYNLNNKPTDMKRYIAKYGSITAGMDVWSDFNAYKGGVYRRTASATYGGGHLVCLIGYNDAGKYWIGKNSWGTGWGEGGYFRIAYGQCRIENFGSCGIAGVTLVSPTVNTRQALAA
jgi:C1A family cysteine protease